MVLRSKNKPPLARSPIQLRSRRKTLEPTFSTANLSPPGPNSRMMRKLNPLTRSWEAKRSELRPEYQTMSSELTALAKKVQELGPPKDASDNDVVMGSMKSCPLLFERGRLYNEYSALRNERLKRKKVEMMEEEGHGYGKELHYGDDDHNAVAEASKKRETGRRNKPAAPPTPMMERERYSIRSSGVGSKENKKPPVPVAERSQVGGRMTRKG